jgi:hypothetical protein
MTNYLDFTTGNDLLDQGIENYLIHGIPPGGFLTAVLSNNLFLAANCADHWNRPKLAGIAKSVYHHMPAKSCGSSELVRDWINDVDQRRSNYAHIKHKEYTFRSLKGTLHAKESQHPLF